MENRIYNFTDLRRLRRRLDALAVFRGLLVKAPVSGLRSLLASLPEEGETPSADFFNRYGAFAHQLYENGGDLGAALQTQLLQDENAVLKAAAKGREIPPSLQRTAEAELAALQEAADLTPAAFQALAGQEIPLPEWETSPTDLRGAFVQALQEAPVRGWGIFAQARAFRVRDGHLSPVRNADDKRVSDLIGYERERARVLENTRALAEGRGASNVLLYGDAGTGKSSTVKACANEFADQGLRLIEFEKNQLSQIPAIIDQVYDAPLKFIFFIDDLNFSEDDDAFCQLKGILEGNVTGGSPNIAIYVTSNRRHLVRESMEDRTGSEIHINETIQQMVSLSDRFGLAVLFSVPKKKLYLDIVHRLAQEERIDLPTEELDRRAEAFALRRGGRSPRAAEQFIQLLSIGL